MSEPRQGQVRVPTLADALIRLGTLAALIAGSLASFGLDALDVPTQVGLLLAALVAALAVPRNGHSWADVQWRAQGAMSSMTIANFIVLAVGALIGVWNHSGRIPTPQPDAYADFVDGTSNVVVEPTGGGRRAAGGNGLPHRHRDRPAAIPRRGPEMPPTRGPAPQRHLQLHQLQDRTDHPCRRGGGSTVTEPCAAQVGDR